MCSESIEALQHAIDGAMQRTRAELDRVEALLMSRQLRLPGDAAADAARDGAIRESAIRDGAVRDGAVRDGASRGAVSPEVRERTVPDGSGRVYLVLPAGVAGAELAARFLDRSTHRDATGAPPASDPPRAP